VRKTREILRLHHELRLSNRQVAASLGISAGCVSAALSRARQAHVSWSEIAGLGDEALDARLYGAHVAPGSARPEPDWANVHVELRRVGVTLQLLHMEYLALEPDGLKYSAFCERYRHWVRRRGLTMRQVHRAGDKMFVDYSGKRPHYIDPKIGEAIPVELFVAVLGASSYTFTEATATQRGPDWIASHCRAFAYFEGVARMTVPDQLKSGVTKACRYEPAIQRTYEEMAAHYGTSVLPARPMHPKDKAKVEVGVQIAQRWILARLRHQTFHSLAALNERIAELLVELNARVMRKYGASRLDLYERLDRPALQRLPAEPFRYGEWRVATVNIDYHVEVEHNYYSVPYHLAGEKLDVRVATTTVEVYRRGERVASHPRLWGRAQYSTNPEHMPVSHRAHREWTPSRLVHWGGTIGPRTAELLAAILADRPHPEMGYRSCLGIIRLGGKFDHARLEEACRRSLLVGARSYRHVASILQHGLDQVPLPMPPVASPQPVLHENIRGQDYYE